MTNRAQITRQAARDGVPHRPWNGMTCWPTSLPLSVRWTTATASCSRAARRSGFAASRTFAIRPIWISRGAGANVPDKLAGLGRAGRREETDVPRQCP